MKHLLFAAAVVAFGFQAQAKGHDYLTYSDFRYAKQCANVANLLGQVSSPELTFKVTKNCKLHRHNVGASAVTRVVVDIGTWGINEIACAGHSGAGCGTKVDVFELEATVRGPKQGRSAAGQSLVMLEEDCAVYTKAISNIKFYGKTAKLEATCTGGLFTVVLKPVNQ